MASGPAAGLEVRYARIGRAAFALARRICGDDATAAAVVEQAFAGAREREDAAGDGLLLRRVRHLACQRRRTGTAPAAGDVPPRALAALPVAQWRVLDLVALRGAGVREAAHRLHMSEASVLAHLHDALLRSRALLSGARQPDDHTDSVRLALLR